MWGRVSGSLGNYFCMVNVASALGFHFTRAVSINYCHSFKKFQKLVGPLAEIVTIYVHKYNVTMPRHRSNMTLMIRRCLIRETRCQDVRCFIRTSPAGRGAPTYDFTKFSRKLHEMERIWAPRGVGAGHP